MQSKILSLLNLQNKPRYTSLATLLFLSAGYTFSKREESFSFFNTRLYLQKIFLPYSSRAQAQNPPKEDNIVNNIHKRKIVHDSDDSESDVEDFHTPSLDSDTENEFNDDDHGFLVETDSEEEGSNVNSGDSDNEA